MAGFDELKGLILASVVNNDNKKIVFTTDTGRIFTQEHHQDCCESVSVEEIHGDLADLVGSPILLAEETTSKTAPANSSPNHHADVESTWTFYKLATIKGSVTIRWYGTSNGYYSTDVSFGEIT